MPHIDSTKFAEITIDGKKYRQVLILGDDVKERDYDRLKELFGTSHKTGDWEIEELLENNPEIIVVGTGQDGMMELSEDLIKKAQEKNIEVIANLTPQAIKIYNKKTRANQRLNALIHTTC